MLDVIKLAAAPMARVIVICCNVLYNITIPMLAFFGGVIMVWDRHTNRYHIKLVRASTLMLMGVLHLLPILYLRLQHDPIVISREVNLCFTIFGIEMAYFMISHTNSAECIGMLMVFLLLVYTHIDSNDTFIHRMVTTWCVVVVISACVTCISIRRGRLVMAKPVLTYIYMFLLMIPAYIDVYEQRSIAPYVHIYTLAVSVAHFMFTTPESEEAIALMHRTTQQPILLRIRMMNELQIADGCGFDERNDVNAEKKSRIDNADDVDDESSDESIQFDYSDAVSKEQISIECTRDVAKTEQVECVEYISHVDDDDDAKLHVKSNSMDLDKKVEIGISEERIVQPGPAQDRTRESTMTSQDMSSDVCEDGILQSNIRTTRGSYKDRKKKKSRIPIPKDQ